MFILLILSVSLTIVSSTSPCSFFSPNQTERLVQPPPIYINDTDHDALLFFSINCSNWTETLFANLSMKIDNPRSIELRKPFPTDFFTLDNTSSNATFNLTVHGTFLGYSQLYLHLNFFDANQSQLNFSNDLRIDFAVKRKSTVLDTIFTVIVIILVCIGTFLIGCRLKTENLYSNIRRPVPILIGLFSQFLCLPLVK